MSNTLLPKVSEVFNEFPLRLITPLRAIVGASSASDALTKYGNFFDVLIGYLADLANSVYVAQDTSSANESVEKELRKIQGPLTLGRKLIGFRTFEPVAGILSQKIPELEPILTDLRLPPDCIRMTRAFMAIESGCREYAIPPTHLSNYVDVQLKNGSSKFTFYQMCDSLVKVRNASAHVGADTWFPNDPKTFEIACKYLRPAVDELLTWAPMKSLLTTYEVVEIQAPASSAPRTSLVTRFDLGDGRAPLGPSTLHLDEAMKADKDMRVVARRTSHPGTLEGLAPFVKFPSTLLSHEHINRSYADVYLRSYLESGLITPLERQKLELKIKELAVPRPKEVESAIKAALQLDQDPSASLARLSELCGELSAAQRERIESQLPKLRERRMKYIFEQIEDKGFMTFAQLEAEVELDQPDLESVLAELIKEGRVSSLSSKHYKAQDPTHRARLLALLGELMSAHRRPRLPLQVLELVRLCAKLLDDDGVPVTDADLEPYKDIFDVGGSSAPEQTDTEGSMQLLIGDRMLRPRSVRELFKYLMPMLAERNIDLTSVLPWKLGRSRYLAAQDPLHSNGTPFQNPMQVDGVTFEGNVGRAQALTEVIRILAHFGIEASSPDIEQSRSEPDDIEDTLDEDVDDESDAEEPDYAPTLHVCPPGHGDPITVTGPTVRRFLAALVDVLVQHGADLGSVAPLNTGRVRYLLAEEPYHHNGRPFDAWIERDGFCINVAYTYEQALAAAEQLCVALGWTVMSASDAPKAAAAEPLVIQIGGQTITADDVPSFFRLSITALYDQGLLTSQDIPFKAGHTRYLIAKDPKHENGGDFARPIEVVLGGVSYYMEVNINRALALTLITRLHDQQLGRSDG